MHTSTISEPQDSNPEHTAYKAATLPIELDSVSTPPAVLRQRTAAVHYEHQLQQSSTLLILGDDLYARDHLRKEIEFI